jgi:hypothetical protein
MRLMKVMRRAAFAALAALLMTGVAAAQGDPVGQAQPELQAESFTLEPGATAEITFEAFCYQFGESFPAALTGPSAVAESSIRAALNLARAQDLTGSDEGALEVQYAIWQLQGEADAPTGGETARQIVNQTRAAPDPAAPTGTSLVEAAQAGQVTVSVAEFAPVGQPVELAPGVTDNFFGRGRLSVTSNVDQPIELYMPIGTIIAAADPADQDIVAYATDIDAGEGTVAQAPTQTPTPAPTQTPTPAPTQTPTPAPTQTPTPAPQRADQSFIEPIQPGAAALPDTSGGGLPLIALVLGGLSLAAHGLRRWTRHDR